MTYFLRKYWDTLLLLAISIIAYGQTLFMYFLHDDYAVYYLFQQGKILGYPYQINSLLANAAISLFGLNSAAYFMLAIILFFIVSIIFKNFIYLLTKDRAISFICAALFASGYVGQRAIEMFLGNGIVTLPALTFFFLCLIGLIKYVNLQKNKWLLLSLLSFALTLEIAPHRHASFFIVNLGVLVLFLSRKRVKKFFILAIMFGALTFVELFVHPTKLLLGYETGSSSNFIVSILSTINSKNILNLFGSFWNSVYPVNNNSSPVTAGVILFLFIVSLLLLKVPKYDRAVKIMLVLILGSLLTFFMAVPDLVLESEHRYLLTVSYASAIIPLTLISRSGKKMAAILIASAIILLRLSSGVISQREFVNSYSRHSKNIFSQIKTYIPIINSPVAIYIEGSTKALNFAVGDAFRVGVLPSEAAVAVHYKTSMENIILPESLSQMEEVFSKNKMSLNDIYTFIYDGNSLKDTSLTTRRLIKDSPQPVDVLPSSWQVVDRGYLFEPDFQIETLVPVFLHISIDLSSKSWNNSLSGEKIVVRWEYNTSGDIREKMEAEMLIKTGRNLLDIKIPAGGEYLSRIRIDFDKSELNSKINYAKFSYEK